MPTLVLANRSSFDCLFQQSPNYHILCTFGCLYFPFLHLCNNHKLDFCSSPCVFFGYSSFHLGYRCFDIVSQCIYIFRHVHFKGFHSSPHPTRHYLLSKSAPFPIVHHSYNPSPSLSTSALPPFFTHPPHPLPFTCPLSHACLSNHYAPGTACKSISLSFLHNTSVSVGTIFSSSSSSPYLANVKVATDFSSIVSLIFAASPLFATNSPSTPSVGLNSMVDLSSYLL